MSQDRGPGERRRLDVDALIVGYAMSRLDRGLLDELGYSNWTAAFAATSLSLGVPHNSMKLLRDEFDVFFPNGRKGWHRRDPHRSRLAVLHEFESVSDEALTEVVRRALSRDRESLREVLEVVTGPAERVANVAERLLTGRRAEEHFMRSCLEIIDVAPDSLRDLRHTACGFDFAAETLPGVAIEVKGLKMTKGGVLFTEREWTEARARRDDYWVVVVGNLDSVPTARVFPDPVRNLEASCQVVKSASTVWRAEASVA